MYYNWKQLTSRALRSKTAVIGYLILVYRIIDTLANIPDLLAFAERIWSYSGVIIDFLGTGWGTLIAVVLGFGFVIFAVWRTSLQPEMSFPKHLEANYKETEFDLNAMEDHISFVFTVDNPTSHKLVLTNENHGHLIHLPDGFRFISSWQIQTRTGSVIIGPNEKNVEFKIVRILEPGLAYEFAFKDPRYSKQKESVSLSFAEMEVGISSVQNSQSKPTQYGTIKLPGETNINVPIRHIHWERYRKEYEKLRS